MDYMQALARWAELDAAIRSLQVEERALREGLFAGTFPTPTEGVNKYPLPDGTIVKGTHKINRSVDYKHWQTLGGPSREKLIATGAFLLKPDLVLSAYRDLTPEQLALVDTVLTIKPGLPSLEIVPPKKEAQ